MIKTFFHPSVKARAFSLEALQVVVGSLFLAFCAQIAIPMHPVPMTLQTLGVFLLGISLGGRKAGLAVLLYLVEATMGLPVLARGMMNPLWILGPTAGYLLSWPLVAYVVGTLVKRNQERILWVMTSLFCGQVINYSLGVLFLCRLVNLKVAISVGVIPFMPIAAFKLVLASLLSGLYLRFKR